MTNSYPSLFHHKRISHEVRIRVGIIQQKILVINVFKSLRIVDKIVVALFYEDAHKKSRIRETLTLSTCGDKSIVSKN